MIVLVNSLKIQEKLVVVEVSKRCYIYANNEA